MGNVNQESRLVLATGVLKGLQIRRVTVHGKDALGDDQDRVLRVGRPDATELPYGCVGREVPDPMHIRSRSHRSLGAAIVGVLVENYVVLGADQGR